MHYVRVGSRKSFGVEPLGFQFERTVAAKSGAGGCITMLPTQHTFAYGLDGEGDQALLTTDGPAGMSRVELGQVLQFYGASKDGGVASLRGKLDSWAQGYRSIKKAFAVIL